MAHMYSKNFYIKSINNAKELVNIASKYNEDIDLVSGRYVIDAKSIMGIFSLDLLHPVTIIVHTDNIDKANKLFKDLERSGIK